MRIHKVWPEIWPGLGLVYLGLGLDGKECLLDSSPTNQLMVSQVAD